MGTRDAGTICLGEVEAFPTGEMRVVAAGSFEVGVVRRPDGSFHAVRNRCPHKGAPLCRGPFGGTMMPSAPDVLDFGLDGQVIRCPWHGFEFDVTTGRGLFGNEGLRLRTYPVEVRDGAAWITVGRRP